MTRYLTVHANDLRRVTAELTAGGTVAYGVGNRYPEDFTVITRDFERRIWRNLDGGHPELVALLRITHVRPAK